MKLVFMGFLLFVLISCNNRIFNPYQIQRRSSCDLFGYDYDHIMSYFNTIPKNRPDTLKKYFQNPPTYYLPGDSDNNTFTLEPEKLSYFLGISIKDDLEALTGIASKNEYIWGNHVDFFFPKDTILFHEEIGIWEEFFDNYDVIFQKDKEFYKGLTVNCSYLEYVYFYVKNSPKNRIQFINHLKEKVPIDILLLFKADLDKIFETSTPDFHDIKRGKKKINHERFNTAILIWEEILETK